MKAWWSAAVVVVSLAAWAQSEPLQQGLELFRQGQYEAALTQFVAARRVAPDNASINNFIGITETRLGRIEDANRDYEAAARIDPKLAGPHTNLGFNYLSTRQYGQAEKELSIAVALDSADPSTHYYLAVLYLTTSREAQAIPHIEPALPLLTADVPASLLAIEACVRSGDRAEAAKLLALVETKFSPEQESQLATVFTERAMYAEAAERCRRLAEMEPSWQNQSHLAQAYEAAGESQPALEAWRKAIAANPGNPDLYLDCTRLLIDLDRYQEAAEIVQAGVALVPDDYPLTIRLGAIAMMSGDHAKARAIYRQAIAEHPALALGYVALAQSYMKQGNDDEALHVLTTARSAVPRDFALDYVYGLVSFELGDQEQALQAFTSAEQLQPEVAEPHYQLGLLYMKKQAWKEARDEFEQVLLLDPRNAPAYYQLSRTYQRLGQSEKAQQMAKEASLLTKTKREEELKMQQLRFGIPSR